jgi:hypothetical protein
MHQRSPSWAGVERGRHGSSLRKSVTPLEVAEHILQQAASGERDLNRLKSSAFEKLSTAA